MINESWQKENFPLSTRTYVLTLIDKEDKRDNINNYHPASLTNSNYTIIAFAFAERPQRAISSLIDEDHDGNI